MNYSNNKSAERGTTLSDGAEISRTNGLAGRVKRSSRHGCLWLGLILASALPAVSSASIVNGSFNTDLAGWTENGATSWQNDGPPQNGVGQLGGAGELSQVFLCGDVQEPDRLCLVTFKYKADGNAPALRVTLGPLGGGGTTQNLNGTGGVWTVGTITSLRCEQKEIKFAQLGVAVRIDDVKDFCVPVPEPGTLAALGLGAALLRRKKRTV